MPKLLSWKEAEKIASKMCNDIGLPSPILSERTAYGNSKRVRIQCRRYGEPNMFGGGCKIWETSYLEGANLEQALAELERWLKTSYEQRTKDADAWRAKYAMEEADEFLDKELRK